VQMPVTLECANPHSLVWAGGSTASQAFNTAVYLAPIQRDGSVGPWQTQAASVQSPTMPALSGVATAGNRVLVIMDNHLASATFDGTSLSPFTYDPADIGLNMDGCPTFLNNTLYAFDAFGQVAYATLGSTTAGGWRTVPLSVVEYTSRAVGRANATLLGLDGRGNIVRATLASDGTPSAWTNFVGVADSGPTISAIFGNGVHAPFLSNGAFAYIVGESHGGG
jgi:hypothetical protein